MIFECFITEDKSFTNKTETGIIEEEFSEYDDKGNSWK